MKTTTSSSSTAALALFTLVLAATTTTATPEKPSSAEAEEVRMKKWLGSMEQQGLLNKYGDPSDTMYAGGSPLFDEETVGGGG